jgi:hypothetical protein
MKFVLLLLPQIAMCVTAVVLGYPLMFREGSVVLAVTVIVLNAVRKTQGHGVTRDSKLQGIPTDFAALILAVFISATFLVTFLSSVQDLWIPASGLYTVSVTTMLSWFLYFNSRMYFRDEAKERRDLKAQGFTPRQIENRIAMLRTMKKLPPQNEAPNE